jgi:hypothetical protein
MIFLSALSDLSVLPDPPGVRRSGASGPAPVRTESHPDV